MSDQDLRNELTLRDAEIIRLKDIIIILKNVSLNHENILRKGLRTVALLKIENFELQEKAKALEVTEIQMKLLLDELQKIDPLGYL